MVAVVALEHFTGRMNTSLRLIGSANLSDPADAL